MKKEEVLKNLKTIAEATKALNKQWNDNTDMFNILLNRMYPFKEPLNEVVDGIELWLKDAEERLDNEYRFCSVTDELMTAGWVLNNGEKYYLRHCDVMKAIKELGYNSLQEAYDDGVIYYTEWEVQDA